MSNAHSSKLKAKVPYAVQKIIKSSRNKVPKKPDPPKKSWLDLAKENVDKRAAANKKAQQETEAQKRYAHLFESSDEEDVTAERQ